MRYFVYGYYGHRNFGDDLLLEALVAGIRARDANADFAIHSRDAVSGFERDFRVRFTGLARRLEGVRSRPWRALGYLAAFARWIARSDVLVIGGGTLFIDKGRLNLSLVLLMMAAWYARLRRRRVVVVGVAVDAITHPITRWATARIFAEAEFIAMRDDISLSYAKHVPPDRVHRSADLVFGLDVAPPRPVTGTRPVIGLSFIDYFGTVEMSASGRQRYQSAILATIEANRACYDFVWLVLQRGVGQRDDWLEQTLRTQHPGIAIQDVASLDGAREALAKVDAIVTTRYHLGVLALMWDKPVIVIDHELKLRSLAQDFGLPVMSLADFTAGGISDIGGRLSDVELARIAAARDSERSRAGLNFAWLG